MNNNWIKKESFALGMLAGMLILFLAFVIKGGYLIPNNSALTSNQLQQAQIFKYVNTSDIRINDAYFYPNNCINYNTTYQQSNSTTPAYISDVIIGNASRTEAFVSLPYYLNGSLFEYHYFIYCENKSL